MYVVFFGLLIFAFDCLSFLPFKAMDKLVFPRFRDTTDFLFAFFETLMDKSVAFVLYLVFPDFTRVVLISFHLPFFL